MPQVGTEAGKAAAVQLIDALMPRCDATFLLQELNAWPTYQPPGRILCWCPLASAIATYGTLIGAGGGILIVPTLLLLYSHESANTIASVSLAVIFLHAVSATLAYGHMHRINYRAGLLFAGCAVPAGFLGAYMTSFLSRHLFELALSAFILSVAAFIFLRPTPTHHDYQAMSRETIHRLTDFKWRGADWHPARRTIFSARYWDVHQPEHGRWTSVDR